MRTKTIGRLSGIVGLAGAFVAVNATTPLAVTPAAATNAVPSTFAASTVPPHKLAQAHLDRFFDFAASHAASRAVPRVKISVDGTEFWVEPLTVTSNGFTGTRLDGENNSIPGDVVEFTKERVRDWTFVGRNHKIFGNFQARAMLADMPPTAAAQVASVLAEPAIPAAW